MSHEKSHFRESFLDGTGRTDGRKERQKEGKTKEGRKEENLDYKFSFLLTMREAGAC